MNVIKNTLTRLINAYNFVIFKSLQALLANGNLAEVPENETARFELFRSLYKKRGGKEYFDLYLLMKQINASDYNVREEYRKNVTLIAHLMDKDIDVTVPVLLGYYNKTREFVKELMGLGGVQYD